MSATVVSTTAGYLLSWLSFAKISLSPNLSLGYCYPYALRSVFVEQCESIFSLIQNTSKPTAHLIFNGAPEESGSSTSVLHPDIWEISIFAAYFRFQSSDFLRYPAKLKINHFLVSLTTLWDPEGE